jgi:hypothetical protein
VNPCAPKCNVRELFQTMSCLHVLFDLIFTGAIKLNYCKAQSPKPERKHSKNQFIFS